MGEFVSHANLDDGIFKPHTDQPGWESDLDVGTRLQ